MAERIEVRGFLISWATSAAKRSMASIRSDSEWVISSSARDRSPISSLPLGDVGQGDGAGAFQPHAVGGAGQAHHRLGDQAVQQHAGDQGRGDGHQDEGQQGPALGGDDLVDVAGLQGQHAQHRPHVLDRDRDRHHPLAALGHAGAGHGSPVQGPGRPRRTGPSGRARPWRLGSWGGSGASAVLAGFAGRGQDLPLDAVGDHDSCRPAALPWASNSRARCERGMNSTCSRALAGRVEAGSGSPTVAPWSMHVGDQLAWVVRLSMRALIRPLRSSFSTSAPITRIARPAG
jgi:hypothetical protein